MSDESDRIRMLIDRIDDLERKIERKIDDSSTNLQIRMDNNFTKLDGVIRRLIGQ